MEDHVAAAKFGGSIDLAWDFYGCGNGDMLVSPEAKEKIIGAIREASFTYVDSCFHKFEGDGEGYSFVSIIGESHVAIHTWPERSALELTVHYCNYTKNNDALAMHLLELLKDIFEPHEVVAYSKRVRCLKAAEVATIA